MITFRCTKRVAQRFRLQLRDDAPASTGILGDWYANLLNIGRQRLVLCVSERTLLPVILPARQDAFPGRFREHLRWVLKQLDIPDSQIEAEVAAAREVTFAPTRSRQVLGVMNDFAFMAKVGVSRQHETIDELVRFLAGTPCSPLGMDHPDRVTQALFWRGSIT
jgi:hypothetical protein